jgi:hypothetical protein
VNGGPYSQYVLLIFSDEPWLERDHVERSRKEHSFDLVALTLTPNDASWHDDAERSGESIPSFQRTLEDSRR